MPRYRWLILVLVIVLVLPSCAKKEVVPVEEVEEPVEETPPPPPPPPPLEEEEPVEEVEPLVLEDVFFDFDKYTIKAEYQEVLSRNAEMLLSRPDAKLLIEGHCDERGTKEYNLSLGEKRAKAVIDYYVTYGISSSRLSMISYGEEKPFSAGHNEDAWTLNRRAHMVLK